MRHNRLFGFVLVTALAIGAARDARAQNAVISGTVTSVDGRSVFSATVDIGQLNIAVPTNAQGRYTLTVPSTRITGQVMRSEEHTSELQSHSDLVCRLLLEKKKKEEKKALVDDKSCRAGSRRCRV